MSQYQLAQLNVAKMKFDLDDPRMKEFVDNLDNINALAEESPGFIWRLQTDEGDATSIDYFGSDVLVNMSVWNDVESLHQYVYRSAHNEIMSKRKEWFDRIETAYTVLWWIPSGQFPSIEEADLKLQYLREHGPTDEAFTFKQKFPLPNQVGEKNSA